MDALMIVNAADLPAGPNSDSLTAVELLLSRARTAQGIVVFISAPVPGADPADGTAPARQAAPAADPAAESAGDAPTGTRPAVSTTEPAPHDRANPPDSAGAVAPEPDDLVLTSAVADAFDDVEDLAEGLGDLQVDRLVMAGVDAAGALRETAMAGLALGFDVLLVSDACRDEQGRPVDWMSDAQEVGAIARPAVESWLRM